MSYSGFAGYHCHSTQLSTQLSLMTTNPNNSVTDSSCCPTSVADNRSNTSNSTSNTNMNVSVNEDNHLQSAVSNTPLSSSSSSSVCTLTSPYESRIISSYPRLGGLYGSSYSEQNSFYPSGANPFYSSFGHPYDLKDPNGNGWGALPQTTCYPYDPTVYSPYGERYSAMDSAARRKNATRETTNTLKAWLYEHRKNPYPTKGEKIMLAIITKMTLTQVSTWFANARRRLKKENKMTWEPRNKSTDGHDSDDKESCKDTDDNSSSNIADNQCLNGGNKLSVKKETDSTSEKSATMTEMNVRNSNSDSASYEAKDTIVEKSHSGHLHNGHETKSILSNQINNNSRPQLLSSHHIKHDSATHMLDNESIGQRPKIWSLAQTATSESPPYSGKIASVTPTEWSTTLPPAPDGLQSLSDYQRECPQGSRLSTSNLRKCPPTWPEEHCVTNLGSSRSAAMQLFTSDTNIGPHNYLNSGKPTTSGPLTGSAHHLHHHPHHPFSTSIPHLVHANPDSFSTAYNVSTNGMRPIIDSQSCHNLVPDINENRLSNGSISKSNTFLCKVFPEYISSGPDALLLNDNNSERGGSTLSIEDSSMSSSSSPNLESNHSVRHINGSNSLGFSAFRPMLKR